MEPTIVDPDAHGHFPVGGQAPIYEVVTPRNIYDDAPIRRPSLQQRMSNMRITEVRPNSRVRRDSTVTKAKNYLFYRLEKVGDDWERARKSIVPAKEEEIQKLAKKFKGSVLAQSRKMGDLRRQQLERLIESVNDSESGAAVWEPVYLEVDKDMRRSGKVLVKSMDVILARNLKTQKERSKLGGQIVDLSEKVKEKKEKPKDKDDERKKDKKEGDFDMDDPFNSAKLFAHTGKPLDRFGILDYHNGGLPPEIPRDEPIGKKPEKKDKKHRRGKSKDRGGDDDLIDLSVAFDDPMSPSGRAETLDEILGSNPLDVGGKRGRRGSLADGIEVMHPRSRSRSQKRRSGSRRRSASRQEPVRIPPSYYPRADYRDVFSSGSSESSDASRYGLDQEEERSSYTSHDTFTGARGRGSRYYHDDPPKMHRRGSSRGPRKYYEEPLKYERRGSRRYSKGYYHDQVPESRQIEYNDPHHGTLVHRPSYSSEPLPQRRHPVHLHFPGEMVDLDHRQRTAEMYMDNVRDEFLDRREQNISRREQRLDERDRERRQSRRLSGYGGYGNYDPYYH